MTNINDQNIVSENGWGWAAAAAIPVVGPLTTIYYGYTRKHFAPIFTAVVLPFVAGIGIGLADPSIFDDEDTMLGLNILGLGLAPLCFKAGHNLSKDEARRRLGMNS